MSENDNLEIWNAVEKTDPKYTKQFSRGGGFRGTATNATYLIKKATKMFGPIGIGWGWNILEEKIVDGAPGDKIHYLKLQLWYSWKGGLGKIEHFGQTTFVGKNKNGPFTDEEAPKKSLTDALSKALSTLGFASDIHLGQYDDNRYVNDLKYDFKDSKEFGDRKSNDNGSTQVESKTSDRPGVRSASVSETEQDTIIDTWERLIKEAATVKQVMEIISDANFAPDMTKLHENDEKFIRDLANNKSQDLKKAKTKDAA